MTDVPGLLEIRVHGVHGTSPKNMLGTEDIGQVAGDNITGFYRSKDGKLPNRTLPPHVTVEAYSWGSLTSGVAGFFGWLRRAMWLFLLPFALANLAYWSRCTLNGERQERAARSAAAVRVGALLLTLLMVVTACFVGIDLVAWQCFRGGVQGCPALPGVFDFMANDPMQTLPRRVAVGALAPLATVVLLWVLSARSVARLEEVDAEMMPGARDMRGLLYEVGPVPILAREDMWHGGRCVVRLRRLHLAIALLAVLGYSGLPLLYALGPVHALVTYTRLFLVDLIPPRSPGDKPAVTAEQVADAWNSLTTPHRVDLTLLTVGLIVALVVLWQVGRLGPGDVEYYPLSGKRKGPIFFRSATFAGWLLALSGALLAVHLLLLLRFNFGVLPQGGDLFLHNIWFIATFVALALVGSITFIIERWAGFWALVGSVVLVVGFAGGGVYIAARHLDREEAVWTWILAMVVWLVLVALHYGFQRRDHEHEAWGGAACSVMFNASAWTALLFTTAAVTLVADRLNGDGTVADLQTQYTALQVGASLRPGDDPIGPQQNVTSTPRRDPRGGFPGVQSGPIPVYRVDGDITLVGGIVEVTKDDVVIRSGKLLVDTLARRSPGDSAGRQRNFAQMGSAKVRTAQLEFPDGTSLALQDSCRDIAKAARIKDKQKDKPCTVERDHFVASAFVDVSEARVVVETPPMHRWVQLQDRTPPQTPIVLPQVLIWAPIGQMLWFLLVLAIAGGCWIWLRARVRPSIKAAVVSDRAISPRDKDLCTRARVQAAYTHRAETLLDIIGLFTVPVVLAILAFSSTGLPPWQVWEPLRPVAKVAMFGVLALALGLVLVLSRMRTSDGSRRAVGILWDLTSFWPRAAHPFAPPCYAERVVPELLTRVRWALGREGHHVVLSGHSQGSAIVLAVVQRLGPEKLTRLRIITYGSQIRAWYGRIFPGVMGPDVIGNARTTGAPRFRNPDPDAPRVPSGGGNPGPAVPDAFRRPWSNTAAGQAAMLALAVAQQDVEAEQARVKRSMTEMSIRIAGSPPVERMWIRRAAMISAHERLRRLEEVAKARADALREQQKGTLEPCAVTPWWVNLYRLSDPIGFRVFSDNAPSDAASEDSYVQEVPIKEMGDPTPYVRTHGDYQHSAEYEKRLKVWFDEVQELGAYPPGIRVPNTPFRKVPFFPDA